MNSDAFMGFSGKIDTSREESKFLVDEVIRPEKIQNPWGQQLVTDIDWHSSGFSFFVAPQILS